LVCSFSTGNTKTCEAIYSHAHRTPIAHIRDKIWVYCRYSDICQVVQNINLPCHSPSITPDPHITGWSGLVCSFSTGNTKPSEAIYSHAHRTPIAHIRDKIWVYCRCLDLPNYFPFVLLLTTTTYTTLLLLYYYYTTTILRLLPYDAPGLCLRAVIPLTRSSMQLEVQASLEAFDVQNDRQ
jgi:hypothetical protein